jgi:hypothetical protein
MQKRFLRCVQIATIVCLVITTVIAPRLYRDLQPLRDTLAEQKRIAFHADRATATVSSLEDVAPSAVNRFDVFSR